MDNFLQSEHIRPFKDTKPLALSWRLHVLEETGYNSRFTLCCDFHHYIADTKSAIDFTRLSRAP